MSLREKLNPVINCRRGSVMLETALVIPVLIAVGLFLYHLAYLFVTYNCVSEAMYRTGDFFAQYALLYHENGIEKMEDNFSDILASIGGMFENEEKDSWWNQFFDHRKILLFGDDVLYQFAAEQIFENYLSAHPVFEKLPGAFSWQFGSSTFYNGNEEFLLHGKFFIKFNIPFCEWLISGFSFEKTLRCRAFLEGDMPDYADSEEADSIWLLSNFQRGKAIQSLYGRNLPTFFPEIDYFRDGTVGSIRSIDHTKKTYADSEIFRMVLNKILVQIADFSGASYGDTVIEPYMIRKRELILVLPENALSAVQETVLRAFERDCKDRGVILKIERYQRSG